MKFTFLLAIFILSGCASQQTVPSKQSNNVAQSEAEKLLTQGYQELRQRNTRKAIENYFDKVIALCKHQYNNPDHRVYASRSPHETLYYMVKSASEDQQAKAIGPTCADALYLKGYASLDLGNIDIAVQHIQRAIAMSPVNAMYLSELGHIYQLQHDWQKAMEMFTKAEEYAATYSPAKVKNQELARAKRGIGFTLIELGKLDDAENKFHECLEIDPQDKGALQELQYIKNLRQNKK